MRRFLAVLFVLFAAAAVGLGGVAFFGSRDFQRTGPLSVEKTVTIAKGTNVIGIARLLHDEGVIFDPLVFRAGVMVSKKGRSLKAGEFRFPAGVSARGTMDILADGKAILHPLTLAEGLSTREIIDAINAAPILTGDPVAAADFAEGSLLPETYNFPRGHTRAALAGQMKAAMDRALAAAWASRDDNLPLKSPAEALVLASIVEKETGLARERDHVAGVFINRLRKGMPLQSDPTTIYALTLGQKPLGRALRRKDLAVDSPYNTYKAKGLPPGPICNPGRAAIDAVLHPLATKDLYFVADGTGGHAFARTNKAHLRNVAKWREIQRTNRK